MGIRTYYWSARVRPYVFRKVRNLIWNDADRYFRVGNAGDILVKDLIEWYYKRKSINILNDGRRLLLVGSISHRLNSGDILAGIGSKGEPLPSPPPDIKIVGLRGPITYETFKRSGYDVSGVKFLYDPGLLIKYMYDFSDVKVIPGKISFIPHYRERSYYRKVLHKNISIIDIDDSPENVARQIISSEIIFSSSLHGIIFSHSLSRPCRFVKPITEEPILKFEDYYLSVGLPFPRPILNFSNSSVNALSVSPDNVNISLDNFEFPSVDFLLANKILSK